jgi:thioredoxin reductase
MRRDPVDVVVVGGGPAGLSAALVLGRAVKKVLVCDAGPRRNAASEHVHGFLGREGAPPDELRRIGQEELSAYGVQRAAAGVDRIDRSPGGLDVALVDGSHVRGRRVLLATGMVDEVPDLPGIRPHWGRTVFPCPYCHGWELRGRPWGFLAGGAAPVEFATLLKGWSPDVTAFTNQDSSISAESRERLERAGVKLEPRRVSRLLERDGALRGVELLGGSVVEVGALVIRPHQRQVALVQRLGLRTDPAGYVVVSGAEETSLPGVYAAGDLVSPIQSAILSAAAGARAAFAINLDLQAEAARGEDPGGP